MAYTKNNILSATPINGNVGYNNSWVVVDTNANRDLFAQCAYVTNFDDMQISLSAADLNIGNVSLKDHDSSVHASIVDVGNTQGAILTKVTNNISTYNNVTDWDVVSADVPSSNSFVVLPSALASSITVLNYTGYTLYVKRTGRSVSLPVHNNNAVNIELVANTNEISVCQSASASNLQVFATYVKYN